MGQTKFEMSIQIKVLSTWSGETSWKIENLLWTMSDEQCSG